MHLTSSFSSGSVFFVVFVVAIGTSILVSFLNKRAQTLRKVSKTPVFDIPKFKENKVGKVIGEIHSIGEDLVAPISLQKCVGYEVSISTRDGEGHSEEIFNFKELNNFVISRNGHHVQIQSKDVEFIVNKSSRVKTGWPNKNSAHIENFLKSKGINTKGAMGLAAQYTIVEGTFHVGETVAAVGKGKWKSNPKLGSPTETIKYLEMTPTKEDPVYLSDEKHTFT
ncbi:MAG: hypothetical protein AAF193_06325 [Bacteroidota bacterium]